MTAFTFTHDQLVAITACITADELARQFNHYTDSLTRASWHGATKIGIGGLGLTDEQMTFCLERLYAFFGKEEENFRATPDDSFGDWVDRLMPFLAEGIRQFSFLPAVDIKGSAIIHPADELVQDTRAVANLVQGRRRVISMVAPHSLFGFVTSVLAPNLLDIEAIDGRALFAKDFENRLAPGDLVVATPTLWRFLLKSLPGFPTNIVGLSFGEPMPGALYSTLRENGLAAMREFYGSTETGILAWRENPSDGFALFDFWLRDDDGVIRVRPDGKKISVQPMDKLIWGNGRSFTLGGRRDGAVQIGAVNVFPKAIAKKIAAHPDIKNCEVSVSKRGASLDRLIAKIILEDGLLPDQTIAWKVDAWCRKKLRPPERPRIYTFIDSLE